MNGFISYSRLVPPDFRDRVLSLYPAMAGEDRRAVAYRHLFEHAIFCPFHWEDEVPKLLLPHELVAEFAGYHPQAPAFRSGHWIADFSRDIFPLNATGWNHPQSRCRTIQPEVPAELMAGRDALVLHPTASRVEFVTGRPASARKRKEALRARDLALREEVAALELHPTQHELLELLNNQPPHVFNRLWKANEASVRAAAVAMAEGGRQRHAQAVLASLQKEAASRVLAGMEEGARPLRYRPVARTDRLYAIGASIHCLPRELRQLALAGCNTLDLTAAQLAIVSVLWDSRKLRALLERGRSFWTTMLADLGLEEALKPLLKRACYAVCYGMARGKVLDTLADGEGALPGLGAEVARRFMSHTLIEELFEGRDRAIAAAMQAGGVEDAWGGWIRASRNRQSQQDPAHAALARQAQSIEFHLMTAAVPVIQAAGDICVTSWLHDGLSFSCSNASKSDRRRRQIQEAINKRADELNIPTCIQ